jgi:excisionase family DNA binding protein
VSTELPVAGRDLASEPEKRRGETEASEYPVNVKAAARFLGVSPSLIYAYVERRQIPHYRMMGRAIRFRISELAKWRQQFHVDGGIE